MIKTKIAITKVTMAAAGLWMLAGSVWLAMAFWPQEAHAQYACPNGPGPGERQVGMAPPVNGQGGGPLCVSDNSSQQSQASGPPVRQAPVILRPLYAAFAFDFNTGALGWSTFARDQRAAESGAMEACRNSGGKKCGTAGWFSDQCGSIVADASGNTLYNGYGKTSGAAATKGFEACNKGSPGGLCMLKSLPVCSRYDPGSSTARLSESNNRLATSATYADLKRMSDEYDTREYWGAFMLDGPVIAYMNGATSKAAAIEEAKSTCKTPNCKVMVSWRDSCATTANPENTTDYYAATDKDPKTAYSKAIKQCEAKTGKTCAAHPPLCSGRAYIGYRWGGA